jgi:hypothetical protein
MIELFNSHEANYRRIAGNIKIYNQLQTTKKNINRWYDQIIVDQITARTIGHVRLKVFATLFCFLL